MKFPYTVTADNITIFVGGQIIKMPSTHSGFKLMVQHLQGPEHDEDTIRQLSDKVQALSRLTAGKVSVIGNTVYYRGVPVRSALSDRLVMLTDAGYDATPWALFMDKVMQNPSENSKERLFQFLDRWSAPLTPDGDFIAFKGVNEDYTSTRTGPDGIPVYNRPGDTVEMPREQVEENPDITCASGLHACASHYLDSFWKSKRIVALSINPKDVVSIPSDYRLSKMRVCRYHVLGDVEDQRHRDHIETSQVIAKNDEGRVTRVSTEPFVLKETKAVEYGGYTYIETDRDFEEREYAVCNRTGKVGMVTGYYEVTFTDEEHPQHSEWKEGTTAGDDIKDLMYIVVQLDTGEVLEGTFDPNNSDTNLQDFTPVVLVGSDEDDEDPDFDDHGNFDEDEDDQEDEASEVFGEEEDYEFVDQANFDDDEDGTSSYDPFAGDDGTEEELSFEHDATRRVFTASQLIAEVSATSQRAFSRKYGIPRTTLQDWLRRASAE